MLRNLALMLVLIALGLGLSRLYDTAPSASEVTQQEAQTYAQVPDFAFTDLAGKQHRMSDYRGKVVLLNFWASWCVPCRVEFPQFINLVKAQPDDVVILAFSVDHDKAAMDKFLAELPELKGLPNIIIVHDRDKAITQDIFQVAGYPETILVAPDMSMRRKYLGIELAWDGPDFAATLKGLLQR